MSEAAPGSQRDAASFRDPSGYVFRRAGRIFRSLDARYRELLNVNGDETAAGVATALQANRLIFLTDVEGVLDAEGKLIERVPPEVSLLEAPFVTGGMKPKLRAVAAALAGGVTHVSVGRTEFGRRD
mgnify:CR=1 FL=1